MSPSKYPSVLFTSIAFALCWAIIGATTLWGAPTNSLHTSAQAWAFGTNIAILIAYGVPAVTNWSAPK